MSFFKRLKNILLGPGEAEKTRHPRLEQKEWERRIDTSSTRNEESARLIAEQRSKEAEARAEAAIQRLEKERSEAKARAAEIAERTANKRAESERQAQAMAERLEVQSERQRADSVERAEAVMKRLEKEQEEIQARAEGAVKRTELKNSDLQQQAESLWDRVEQQTERQQVEAFELDDAIFQRLDQERTEAEAKAAEIMERVEQKRLASQQQAQAMVERLMQKREREAAEREAREREAAEREAREREAVEGEAREREAVEREAREREAAEREAREREAAEREAREREAAERESVERESAPSNSFKYIRLGLASPDKIRSWSYGEVIRPETINYQTLKPERGGLFCEKIFGPTKDWECFCGKYKRVRYKNVVCDRCGVSVTRQKVRRERMGHIELAAPVSHIWYFKGNPSSAMGLMLDMSPRSLEEVIYFKAYMVLDPGNTPLEAKQLLSEKEYRSSREKYGYAFQADIGAQAVRKMLQAIDLDKEADLLREDLVISQGQRRSRAVKRLEIVESFRKSSNRPEWMILDVLPVIPPELRPMVQLDGGRFATSDLNDLYRRVINRNNRLKRLLDLGAPDIIVQNETLMLQEAVDALIHNGRRGRTITGPGERPLKSLTHMLKGKQGRFRQNLLGKRVDYSGRSVIIPGPDLLLHQCGLPKEMALELFKPFVMRELVKRGHAFNIKNAKRKVEKVSPVVWDALEHVIKEHPVLLNRAPTLHRLSIQAFEPVLIEGHAIQLHPMACPAFHADFDGDQMAVHVPLSHEAQAEARILMLSSHNLLDPKNGKPSAIPTQDMILGCYYLSMDPLASNTGLIVRSADEAVSAYQRGAAALHTRVAIPAKALRKTSFSPMLEARLITTIGKILFNEILPEELPYLNEPTKANLLDGTPNAFFIFEKGADIRRRMSEMNESRAFDKAFLESVIAECLRQCGTTRTAVMLDRLKRLGFTYATRSGISMGITDCTVPHEKENIVSETKEKVRFITKQYLHGLLTDNERHDHSVATWGAAKDGISKALVNGLDPYNPLKIMIDSKACGSIAHMSQLSGIRGLVVKSSGVVIEHPIVSSFREGLSGLEYFISTYGSRKGLLDTELRIADSGYLTRRLIEAAQDVIVREEDCGTDQGISVRAIRLGNATIENLLERIEGRYSNETVVHPATGKVILNRNQLIDTETARSLVQSGIEEVSIRSVLSCRSEHGICAVCYGTNLSTGRRVDMGEAVGIIAAQSNGEPGTQLTLRAWHTGGIAGNEIIQELPRLQQLYEARTPEQPAVLSYYDGKITDIRETKDRRYEIEVAGESESIVQTTICGTRLLVSVGEQVKKGDPLTEGTIDPKELLHIQGVRAVQSYILQEVQGIYRNQGVEINDKHIEIILRQMLLKMRVVDAGDTALLPGAFVDRHAFEDANREVLMTGQQPAVAVPVLRGITQASMDSESFISAAAFQETTRVLTDAAVKGRTDYLRGVKENVIIGKLIPAGTGLF
ncbi:DNA-directed RNA polymerase subunit beta' [Paenibacillus sp. UNC451MF]|uniref:DNA-directed RNA polymerase subunit beta' n=1 Tax=Paenibacillus sp. UNC451MF TaxID=1449063 RepID=UPI00068A64D5|nr:DNA-directed RNA polymerase subunit beta' [Paenibacillus sp. UNC451MF]